MLLSGGLLTVLIGFPLSLVIAAVVGALPTLALLARRLGQAKAAMLAAVVAVVLGAAFTVFALAACVATGCVG